MKPTLFLLALSGMVICLHAQPSRDVTAPEAAYMNTISNGLLNSLPKDFHGWDVNFPEYKPAVVGETRTSNCAYGKECFWNFGFHLVYDGTTQAGPDLDKFKDSMKNTAFDWHYVALMTRYTNTHQVVVDISVNDTRLIGDFKYCAGGYKTLPPPPGFDHYIFASVSSCFPKDAQGNITDVNIFTMSLAPKVTDHPEQTYHQGDIAFPLNTQLSTPFKVQVLTVRIYGSRALALEYLSKMNRAELKKLLQ
jgi:hypothetical protein